MDLDGAATSAAAALGLATVDARTWGPRLRLLTKAQAIESFWAETRPRGARFTLYGSGDFHHLAAVWLRSVSEPVHLISFDNHPDWDRRPPRWACGAWLNRALELPHVTGATVWGCGNFELAWPHRITGRNDQRLHIRPWRERLKPADAKRYQSFGRDDWRKVFTEWCGTLAGTAVYVTIDLDALADREAVTNWEAGLFTVADIVWALHQLHRHAGVVGGDLCGAWSEPRLATPFQRLAAWWDHPGLTPPDARAADRLNTAAMLELWPALTGRLEPGC